MRVLLVTGSIPPMRCGVGDYTHGVAKALAAVPGTRVGVLTSVQAGTAQRGELEVFPVINTWGLAEASKVARLIEQWSPDIVHIQYPTRGYGRGLLPRWIPFIAGLKGTKVVQTWHESYDPKSWSKLLVQSLVPSGLVVVRSNYRQLLPWVLRWALWNKQYAFIRNASPFPRVELNDAEAKQVRERYLKGQKRLIVFFGFVYRNKGVELLFDIADPATDHIVIAGEVVETSEYHRRIAALTSSPPWAGKATITGFLETADAAALLAVADAVVLPYRVGGGEWNTSLHAAVMQRTFVITTSLTNHGYEEKRNMFFAGVDDAQAMRSALGTYAGRKRGHDPDLDRDEWQDIANEHLSLYSTVLRPPRARDD